MSKIIDFNSLRNASDTNEKVAAKISGNSVEPELTLAEHLSYAADALELIAHNLRVAIAQMQKGKLR